MNTNTTTPYVDWESLKILNELVNGPTKGQPMTKDKWKLAEPKTPDEKELVEIIETDGYIPYQITLDKIMRWHKAGIKRALKVIGTGYVPPMKGGKPQVTKANLKSFLKSCDFKICAGKAGNSPMPDSFYDGLAEALAGFINGNQPTRRNE